MRVRQYTPAPWLKLVLDDEEDSRPFGPAPESPPDEEATLDPDPPADEPPRDGT